VYTEVVRETEEEEPMSQTVKAEAALARAQEQVRRAAAGRSVAAKLAAGRKVAAARYALRKAQGEES
jgi:hypothetical protein